MLSYFLLLLICIKADFEVDGFTYHILESESTNVQVVQCSITSESTLIIPSIVSYESIQYTVTSISSNAFSTVNKAQFKTIYFPFTLNDIESNSISWFTELHTVGFINANNEIVNDTLPPKMTKINKAVFSHCEVMSTINVNNVIELDSQCFQYCFKLNNIKLPKVEIIGKFSFFSTNLSSGIELPTTLREIHDHAFVSSYVTNLTGEVPNLELINGAFVECPELTYIPNLTGIVRLENFAFSGCYYLKEVHCGPKLSLIPTSCFNGCLRLESFTTESKSYSISSRAFCLCSSLKTFNFECVNEALDNAFESCYSFVMIDMSNSHMEEVLPIFQDCANLTSLILPQNLTRFDLASFEETEITSFTFSGTKGKLDLKAAFYNCKLDLEEVIFAPSCDVDLDSTFASCYQLARVVLPKTSYELHSTFVNCRNLIEVENLEFCSLVSYAFYSCDKLARLTSFPSVKTIKAKSFMNCKSLESIPSLSSVEVIESECFSKCGSLKKIECGSELKSIGMQAFDGCVHLETFSITSLNFSIGSESFKSCSSLTGFDFSHCCEIENGAFDLCTSLFEIDLSKSGIRSLSSNSFADCSSLHSVVFPSNLEYIDKMCFCNCVNITSLHFSTIKYIYPNAFENCISLKTVTFENQPLAISSYSFHSCISLTSVELTNSDSNSVVSIEKGAFENCTSLNSFNFDKWPIDSIGEFAFHGCPLSRKLKFKGGSPKANLTVSGHAFSSSLIQSIDLQFDFSSINLNDESFVDCKQINCVMVNKNNKNDVSDVFNNKIINGRHCSNYYTTHIGILVAIILSVLVVIVLITIIIVVALKKKKNQGNENLVQPLITQ